MMSLCVSLSSSFCLLPVVLHNVPQALSQIFQQDLRSRVPSSSRRPSLTASNVSNDVTKHVHTHPSLVISVIPILQIFAVPNAELHMWLEIQREIEVGEHELVRVQVIYQWHVVP